MLTSVVNTENMAITKTAVMALMGAIVVLGTGCTIGGDRGPIEWAASADGRGCVHPYTFNGFYAPIRGNIDFETKRSLGVDVRECERQDVLRWEDAEGAVFQRLIAANRCQARIVVTWCMGGGDGEAKACADGVLPPNGTYKSDPYDASEMNGTYTFRRVGSMIPANDHLCLPEGANKDFVDTRYVLTASSMKQTEQGSGQGGTVVNVESGTGVKGAVGRGIGNVIEGMTEGMIWDALRY